MSNELHETRARAGTAGSVAPADVHLTVVDFQDQQAFEGALNYTGILVFKKDPPPLGHSLRYSYRDDSSAYFEVPQGQLTSAPWVFRRPDGDQLVRKAMEAPTSPLGDLTKSIAEGIVTGKNDVFVLAEADVLQRRIEGGIIRRVARGRSIRRYLLTSDGTHLIYPYRSEGDKTIPIEEETLRSRFPNAYSYLSEQRERLAGRGYFDRSSKAWYELWSERSIGDQQVAKLITPELSSANSFAMAPPDVFYLDTACGLALRDDVRESPLFVLGLLNSKWANYYYRNTTVPKANGFLIYKTMYLRNFAVRRINFADVSEVSAHDLVVRSVERTLELHERLADKQNVVDYEREQLEHEMTDLDGTIDAVIFDLYGLSASDRGLIESSPAVARSLA